MFSHGVLKHVERSRRFDDAVLGVIGGRKLLRSQAGSGHTRLFDGDEGVSFGVSKPINGAAAACSNGGAIGVQGRFRELGASHRPAVVR